MRSMRREPIGAPYEFSVPSDDVLASMHEMWERAFEEASRKLMGKWPRMPIGAAYGSYLRSLSESGEPPPEMPIPMDGTWERVLDD
jgi:hypothetical protein